MKKNMFFVFLYFFFNESVFQHVFSCASFRALRDDVGMAESEGVKGKFGNKN